MVGLAPAHAFSWRQLWASALGETQSSGGWQCKVLTQLLDWPSGTSQNLTLWLAIIHFCTSRFPSTTNLTQIQYNYTTTALFAESQLWLSWNLSNALSSAPDPRHFRHDAVLGSSICLLYTLVFVSESLKNDNKLPFKFASRSLTQNCSVNCPQRCCTNEAVAENLKSTALTGSSLLAIWRCKSPQKKKEM